MCLNVGMNQNSRAPESGVDTAAVTGTFRDERGREFQCSFFREEELGEHLTPKAASGNRKPVTHAIGRPTLSHQVYNTLHKNE